MEEEQRRALADAWIETSLALDQALAPPPPLGLWARFEAWVSQPFVRRSRAAHMGALRREKSRLAAQLEGECIGAPGAPWGVFSGGRIVVARRTDWDDEGLDDVQEEPFTVENTLRERWARLPTAGPGDRLGTSPGNASGES